MEHPRNKPLLGGTGCQPAACLGGHPWVLGQAWQQAQGWELGQGGCRRKPMSGRRDRLQEHHGTPAPELCRAGHAHGQSRAAAAHPPLQSAAKNIPLTGASSALQGCRKAAQTQRKWEGKPPQPSPCLRQAGGVVRTHFHYRKPLHPREESHQIKRSRVDAETSKKIINKKKMLA